MTIRKLNHVNLRQECESISIESNIPVADVKKLIIAISNLGGDMSAVRVVALNS